MSYDRVGRMWQTRRRSVIVAVALPGFGCGGAATGPGDASPDTATHPMADATHEDAASVADAAADVWMPPVIDAGTPGACDAGEYFVTVDNGASTDVLRSGCGDSGPPEPFLGVYSGGNLVEEVRLLACSSGTSLTLISSLHGMLQAPVVGTQQAGATFDDGDGRKLQGTGSIEFTSAPTLGGTVAGGYVQTLYGTDGGYEGSIAGTFCVFYFAP
jgi:hypothetical protein